VEDALFSFRAPPEVGRGASRSDYHLEDAAQLNEKLIFIQNGASFFLKLLKKPCMCLLKNRCNNLKSKPFEFNCVAAFGGLSRP
jgi:hypothetical protein